MLVATPAASALAQDEAVAVLHKVMEDFVRFRIHGDGAHGYWQERMVAITPGAIATLAVPAALGLVLGVEPEVQQRVVVAVCHQHNVAAASAVAAAAAACA